ncbi:major facilitator superfamily domain-containing protein [Massariosphaeria phaeospora]|uniref:Major facilitator superfamily domain-containing protein n=1 Tax=Massariosphaeria phaeospora TaxID=100035 RepID=A0A7C8I603_9PLEO|nr:major facilitator superfamily domain-containing protein [Massariosphaeria phaeospora]
MDEPANSPTAPRPSTAARSNEFDTSSSPDGATLTSVAAISKIEQARTSLAALLCFTALCLSIFLVALDTVLIPTALPTISRSFHIPDSLYAWTGSAYMLANAASTPFWGSLSDVFGRKAVILIANSVFLGGSIVCAVAGSAAVLVTGRAVQGLGGGGVVVLVHVCVADLFAIRDRSFYLGIVGAVWAGASALGPVLGGIFAEKLHWRWCFYVNLPIITISIITLYFTLDLPNPRTPLLRGLLSIDWTGTFTILTATIFLLTGLQLGSTTSYATPLVLCLLIFGVLAYLLFPLTQHLTSTRAPSIAPIMPLRIFADGSNLAALGVCACDALVFNSVAYFLPLYFQLVLSVSPSTTGVYMLALALPLAAVALLSGHVIERTGRFRDVLQAGLAVMTLGVGLLATFSPVNVLARTAAVLVVIGLGFGPNFHAPLIALQTRICVADIAAGTAAFGFVRMVSGAIGVVVGQVVFQALLAPYRLAFLAAGLTPEFAAKLAGGEAIAEAAAVAALPSEQQRVVKAGMAGALRGTWVLLAVVSFLGLVVSFGIHRGVLKREGGKKMDKGAKAGASTSVAVETEK